MKKILIVGGVAGGATAAARLRRNDESLKIIIFERGKYISYANCGLPYYIGNVIKDREKLFVTTAEEFGHKFNLDVRVCNEVTAINKEKKFVEVFDSEKNIKYQEEYDKLILSPGAYPFRIPVPGVESEGIFTLRNVDDTDKIKDYVQSHCPKSAVVIGAGFIGLEMAENLKKSGADVSIIEMTDRVLPFFDYDTASMLEHHIKFKGVNLHLSNKVVAFEKNNNTINVHLQSGKIIKTELVILSAGIRPDTEFVKKAGLELTPQGSIVVDDYMQTADPDIYAVGDAVSVKHLIQDRYMNIYLAGPANKQGRLVADNICEGNKYKYHGTVGTAILKIFDLSVGFAGVSEDWLKSNNKSYKSTTIHALSHAGYYPGAKPITVKLIFEPETGKIYGGQIVGYKGVDKRLDVLAMLLNKNGTISDLTTYDQAYAPPFSSAKDVLTVAGYSAENIVKGKVKVVYWHQLSQAEFKDAQLLDVRTTEENALGAIPGSISIPVDDLRQRINELDSAKKYIVYCAVGLRGYLASRILSQSGFESVYNLVGGYKTYNMVFDKDSAKDVYEGETIQEDGKMDTEVKGNMILTVDACGLQCPGPIMQLKKNIANIQTGESMTIQATDPAFINDLKSWCNITGNKVVSISDAEGVYTAVVEKSAGKVSNTTTCSDNNNKTIIVFSDDLDKALASFVIANGAAATGRQVTMFFTFWGLSVIKKIKKAKAKRDFMGFMFGKMLPSSSLKLNLSKMGMLGMGKIMMRMRMKDKKVDSLESMIESAVQNGVRLIACQMSMDVMGVVKSDLIDAVEIGGVAVYLEEAEKSNVNLFI